MTKLNTVLPWLTLILVLAVYGLFLARPINLVTADLGRHIKNGELLLTGQWSVLKTNSYSYSHPNYPTTNHHWLSGVVFYLAWKFSGFVGLHLFFILMGLATLFIFFLIAQTRAGPGLAGLFSVLVIPLILERSEIRPEMFSYLLSGLFFWLMLKYRRGEISWKTLLVLPLLEILWVNLHIYFFLGPVIVGVFLLEGLIFRATHTAKRLAAVLGLTVLATLVNPFGLKGALAPLNIFKNFGYRLAENQPVWFIEKLLYNPNYLIFKIVFSILALGFAIKLILNKRSLNLPDLILAIGFSAAGWLAVRNFAIFGLLALPIAAGNWANILKLKPETERWLNRTIVTTLILAILIVFSGELQALYPKSPKPHLGLEKDNYKALDFFKANKLAGPIFNNYDIGGYLIYGLYPQEKVFVDNRPEAYPTEFFQNTYIPMQADENIWLEKLKEYDFKTIIFSRLDYTPWGQAFLANRLTDSAWKTVFKDSRVIILIKNNAQAFNNNSGL